MLECTNLSNAIVEEERKAGHSRTILVGDLNMNPFEKGVIAAAGLHAVASRRIAERIERTVQGRSYPFFYNPMWGLLETRRSGPPAHITTSDPNR